MLSVELRDKTQRLFDYTCAVSGLV